MNERVKSSARIRRKFEKIRNIKAKNTKFIVTLTGKKQKQIHTKKRM